MPFIVCDNGDLRVWYKHMEENGVKFTAYDCDACVLTDKQADALLPEINRLLKPIGEVARKVDTLWPKQ